MPVHVVAEVLPERLGIGLLDVAEVVVQGARVAVVLDGEAGVAGGDLVVGDVGNVGDEGAEVPVFDERAPLFLCLPDGAGSVVIHSEPARGRVGGVVGRDEDVGRGDEVVLHVDVEFRGGAGRLEPEDDAVLQVEGPARVVVLLFRLPRVVAAAALLGDERQAERLVGGVHLRVEPVQHVRREALLLAYAVVVGRLPEGHTLGAVLAHAVACVDC